MSLYTPQTILCFFTDEEEDFDFHLEDGGLTEVSCCSDSFEQEENWETNI